MQPSLSERTFLPGEDLARMAPVYFANALLAGPLLGWTWYSHLQAPQQRRVALLDLLLGIVMIELSASVICYYVSPSSFASFTGLSGI